MSKPVGYFNGVDRLTTDEHVPKILNWDKVIPLYTTDHAEALADAIENMNNTLISNNGVEDMAFDKANKALSAYREAVK